MIKLPELSLRFVAVCDVLGFKTKLDKLTLKEISARYLALSLHIRHFINSTNTPFPDEIENKSGFVDFAIFSDTFLVWSSPLSSTNTSADSLLDLGPASAFFDTCNLFISIGIRHEMPFRIGVSYGEVCIEKDRGLFVGKPISEAHLLEQSQKWIGGACHESCNLSPAFSEVRNHWFDTILYDVPFSNERRHLPALNWPRWCRGDVLDSLTEQRTFLANSYADIKYAEAIKFYHAAIPMRFPFPHQAIG